MGGNQGGDDVVGFGVADLDPGDAEDVQAGLDVGEGEDGAQRVWVLGAGGFVARVGVLAARSAVLAVEDDP